MYYISAIGRARARYNIEPLSKNMALMLFRFADKSNPRAVRHTAYRSYIAALAPAPRVDIYTRAPICTAAGVCAACR